MKHFGLFVVGVITAMTAFGNLSWAQPRKGEARVKSIRVPALPFPDDPDPNVAGRRKRWGSDVPAQLTECYGGELVQPVVLLYASHSRRAVTGQAKSGTAVRVLLFQDNPTLNFYFVRTLGEKPQEGWVPAPFLQLRSPN